MAYYEGEIAPMGGNQCNGQFDWSWIIGLVVVGGLFGGGFGFGGNRGGCATTADVAAGFNNSAVLSSLNDIKLGQLQQVNYNNQGFSGLAQELSSCCCQTQRAIDSVRFENERNTCNIIQAGNANTKAILDYLTAEKMCALQNELAGLKSQISNERQSAYLLSVLRPTPIPAYTVPNPYNPTTTTTT